jgi:hypothetical protein
MAKKFTPILFQLRKNPDGIRGLHGRGIFKGAVLANSMLLIKLIFRLTKILKIAQN